MKQREIKFRSWQGNADKKNKEMIYFNLLDADHKFNPFWNTHIMQYTGYKDKNGKDIYEGDVYYQNGNTDGTGKKWIREIPQYPDKLFHLMGEHVFNVEDIEIIGNIHENPEPY